MTQFLQATINGVAVGSIYALLALGYKAGEVNKLIASLDTDGQSAEDIIRQALKQAAQ